MWVGPKGERPLLPKDEGAGVMISAFICREFGLIREISGETLMFVNSNRLGASYKDKDAAIEVYGSDKKKPLTKEALPFLVTFAYNENKEGYWDYNHMVLQFEDTVDVLKVMYPEYEFVYLFDHSSGHSKQRPDGLNSIHMNKGFGGKVPPMRTTKIEKEEGYLGPFPRTLHPGQVQHLVFQSSDSGPFWMSNEERRLCRHDVLLEEFSEIERNKADLEKDLKDKGINTKGKNKKELATMCISHDIPVKKRIQKVKEGWEGKSKGLQQVLWDRGRIDGNNLSKYTLTGRRKNSEIIDLNTSLRHIMGLCTDFINEEGMLQTIGKDLGVTVLLTPKCHAEIAGEGIEYLWACAKGAYRSLPLHRKKKKDNFKASVRYALSNEVITVERIRRFARRAHQYLIAYHALDSGQLSAEMQDDCLKYGPVAVLKLIQSFKTHRCAMDFDFKFVMNELNAVVP
jgi:hypothetical protein